MNNSDDNKALAFEYVLGTLRGEERDAFAKQLRSDDVIANEVRYWEAALLPAPESVAPLAPKPDTFKNIQALLDVRQSRASPLQPVSFWEKLLPWKMATALAFSMLLVVSGLLVNNTIQQQTISDAPNADYVAVLLNDANEPVLTALTANDGSKLWLKWENWQTPKDHSLQLWSQSRRDGEIRPLLVFDSAEQLEEVELDQATWRLIKDSSHLIITQEDIGGSPIDEPSQQIIAKGICIRIANKDGRA
ncbi:anti-sigma factor [Simiduia curdlanivorans]|uniref:Anti-sigma factor domain-containing protein n=1 Tax=Simiduia curdlanivorans TaxID=1492769 RepID=A0ABV8V739_9GAMM|nr:anti-sigma factor [Simiduia curdlanivorans]MDN3640754.1 anti-sigma factor [Simiduia curdlanivorans]